MDMRKVFLLIGLLYVSFGLIAQNQQVLYGFDNLPQTLLLNPGAKTNYKYHAGVPLLSGISVQAGTSGFTVADLFRDNNINFNTKISNVLSQLETNDFISSNARVEVLSGGFQWKNKNYFSTGFYTEMDMFTVVPKDMLELFRDGNIAFLNRSFLFSNLKTKADILGVIHFGVSHEFSPNFTAGTRFKIYSGSLNVTTNSNTGTFTTREGTDNLYVNDLNNLSLNGYSSGFYNSSGEFDVNASDVIGNTFFGPNLGIGFDLGFTYKIDAQTEFSASLLDIGFINYSEKNRNGNVNGTYSFSGIEFQYDSTNPDYWQELNDDINANILREENNASYSVMRPMKFYAMVQRYFGKSRREESCSDISYHSYYDNAVGAQLFSVFRPTGPQFAFTGFYQRKFSKKLSTRVTYTVDDFSYSNIGFGLSAHIWKVNIFGAVDNMLNLSDIANSNNASFQLGINLLFK
jgi:hypothetical protein